MNINNEYQEPQRKRPKSDLPCVSYPWQTTHYEYWTNLEPSKLAAMREKANKTALEELEVINNLNTINMGKVVKPLTENEQECNREYLLCHLYEQLVGNNRFTYRVKATAMAYFARVLLKTSIMNPRVDVRKCMYICWVIACKSEEWSLKVTVEHILSAEIEKFLSRDEMAKLEVTVMEILEFHLHVIHPRASLQYMLDGLHNYMKVKKSAPRPYQELQIHLRTLLIRTCALYISDIPFIYNPGEISIAILKIFPPNGYSVEDIESYFRSQPWGEDIDLAQIDKLGKEMVSFFGKYAGPDTDDGAHKYIYIHRDENILNAQKALGRYHSRVSKILKSSEEGKHI